MMGDIFRMLDIFIVSREKLIYNTYIVKYTLQHILEKYNLLIKKWEKINDAHPLSLTHRT